MASLHSAAMAVSIDGWLYCDSLVEIPIHELETCIEKDSKLNGGRYLDDEACCLFICGDDDDDIRKDMLEAFPSLLARINKEF